MTSPASSMRSTWAASPILPLRGTIDRHATESWVLDLEIQDVLISERFAWAMHRALSLDIVDPVNSVDRAFIITALPVLFKYLAER